MSRTTGRRHTRRPTPHTAWCARDHRCNLAEHRAEDLLLAAPGARAALTRVRDHTGRDHADIRLRIALAANEPAARRQLAAALAHLHALVTHTATARRPAPRRAA